MTRAARSRLLRFGVLGIVLWLVAAPVYAVGPDDPVVLETFLDGFFAGAMKRYHTPGLVFVMVKDGRLFLAKGYGVADLTTQRPVDPSRTLFRVASISKLVTATAVMQLVEQGKLDLHRDVNAYLKGFQLPATFPEPVTLHQLLTHTAGFDERFFGMAVRRPEELRPLGLYLAENMPRRVLPPGDVVSYSNHGLALAGYVVECVSGEAFEAYAQEHILTPLGMEFSAFSLSTERLADLAVGYEYRDHEQHRVPYDYLQMVAPAAALVTTGRDMARFMIAHLQNGRLGEIRILEEATAQRMHGTQFTHHPKLPGFGYGFMEDVVNGRRLIGHGGNWRGFTSRMVLDPDGQYGFFVSYSGTSPDGSENGLHVDLVEAIFDQYFAHPLPAPSPAPDFTSRASRFTGSYRWNRYIREAFGKLAAAFGEVRVTAEPDGGLAVYPPVDFMPPVHLVEVEPLLFAQRDGRGYAAFRAAPDGRITHMFLNFFGAAAFDHLTPLESARAQRPIVGMIVAMLLSAPFGWPLAYSLRQPRPHHPRGARMARWLAALTAALFIAVSILAASTLTRSPFEFTYGVPVRTLYILHLFWVPGALTVGMVTCTFLAWRQRWWTVAARLHYTAVTLAALVFIRILLYWNLLG